MYGYIDLCTCRFVQNRADRNHTDPHDCRTVTVDCGYRLVQIHAGAGPGGTAIVVLHRTVHLQKLEDLRGLNVTDEAN